MHPDWQRENGANLLDDVAVIQLDAPVTTVAPVPLGPDPTPPRVTVLGRGASTSHRRGAPARCARRRCGPVGDRACARSSAAPAATTASASARRGWSARSTSTAAGRSPPRASATAAARCSAARHAAPVLYGIVSFGGDRCGADRLPSVFAEVARYRDFILAPAPVWAPVATGPVAISGTRARRPAADVQRAGLGRAAGSRAVLLGPRPAAQRRSSAAARRIACARATAASLLVCVAAATRRRRHRDGAARPAARPCGCASGAGRRRPGASSARARARSARGRARAGRSRTCASRRRTRRPARPP